MRKILLTYIQPNFLICILLLGTFSILMRAFGAILEKEPFLLRKSLELMDIEKLLPYKVISHDKIENEDILKALGTNDYIQWILEDSEADKNDTVHYCGLFVTYYSHPDRVPHVPEECFAGGGYQRFSSDDIVSSVNKGNSEENISVKHLVFGSRRTDSLQESTEFSVLYLFNINGVYANSRDEARFILNRGIFRKQSYFCKVEWYPMNINQNKIKVDNEQASSLSRKLLSTILPVLEEEHWPIIKN